MGTCISSEKLPDNVFTVRNIHDDNSRYPKGIIEVTSVELIYTDAKSRDRWVWPLKYLRKYGCDGNIFSFEAGRKCPGGEGLYAFSTKKAAALFQMVARNINVGGLVPDAEMSNALSPQSSGQVNPLSPISPGPPTLPPANPPSLPPVIPPSLPPVNYPPVPSTSPPHHAPINYENLLYRDGQRVPENGAIVNPSSSPPLPQDRRQSGTPSPPSTANLPPPKLNYLEVSFSDPPAEPCSPTSLPAVEVKEERRVSYSKIDIQQTDEYNRAAQQEAALSSRPLPVLGGTTFIDPSSIPTHKKGGGRVRLPTYHGSNSNRSHSDSSVGSPNSLTGSMRDMQAHANGEIPTRHHSSVSAVETSLYQNLTLTPNGPQLQIPQQQQHNYMNLDLSRNTTPQPSLSRKASEQASMYENLTLGKNGTTPKIATNLTPNPSLVTSIPHVSGSAMSTYADLDLRQTSTPKLKDQEETQGEKAGKVEAEPTYPVLEFHTQNGAVKNTTPAPSSGRSSPKHSKIALVSVSENHSNSKVADDKVTYGMLDFQAMDVMRNVVRECELDREEEKRRREEEKRKKLEKESRSKKKKKDRKNSHN